MPAGRSEYDLIIAVHALDDAYKELIRTINQVDEMRVQEPREHCFACFNANKPSKHDHSSCQVALDKKNGK